jgi:PAS domain S-box-containing protein
VEVPVETFAAMVEAGYVRGVIDAAHAVGALGPSAAGEVRAYALEVTPRWWTGTDAALCVTDGALIDVAVVQGLAAALSEDRDQREARIVRAAVDNAIDVFEVTDTDVKVLYLNRAFERVMGYPREEFLGRTFARLRDPAAPKHDEAFYRFNTAPENLRRGWVCSLGSRHRDGSTVFNEVAITTFEDPRDAVSGNVSVRRLTRDREGRERAMAAAHMEFRNVLAALPEALAVIRDERVYFGNAPLFEILGRRGETVIASPFARFVCDDEHPRLATILERGGEVRVQRPDGAVRLVRIVGAGAISFEGRPARILLLDDITDRRLARVTEEHAQRLTALGALAASVAHEINNPLAAVLANLQAALEDADPAGAREATREALACARRIHGVVSDLRAFSQRAPATERLGTGLARAVSAALNLTANALRHLAEIQVEVSADLHVRAHDGPLVQVLVNLLLNAAQAMRAVPDRAHRVTIAAARDGDGVRICVDDTGTGVPATMRERLFEPFATTRGAEGGTGLGLWICRRIVQEYGGDVSLAPRSPHGTRVAFTLPTAEPRPTRDSAPVPTAPRARVLVVDDEVAVGNALRRLLREHEVTCVTSSEEALAGLLADDAPDVVLCDLMMPGLTGDALYRRVVAQRPALAPRFVFITGGVFSDAAADFVAHEGVRVVRKPFDLRELRDAMRAAQGDERADAGP